MDRGTDRPLVRCGLMVVALAALLFQGCAAPPDYAASHAVIVVAAGAPAPEQYAARELARFMKQVTGADLKIVPSAPEERARYLVGPIAARLADPDFSTDDLGSEGIIIRASGNDLILAGGSPRGTLYAVYTYLEDEVGIRWWTPTASHIPSKPDLQIVTPPPLAPLNPVPLLLGSGTRYRPAFWYRETLSLEATDGAWAARNKVNGFFAEVGPKQGGKPVSTGHAETFYNWIAPDKYFKAHPEWFSEIDGERTADRAQLCLTNGALREEMLRLLKARLRAMPTATLASVVQNDWGGRCECEPCQAVEAEEGGFSGLNIRFINALAAGLAEEFPQVSVDTMAYRFGRTPPKITHPRKNVVVRLSTLHCSVSHPLDHESNASFLADLRGWAQITDQLFIWDHTTNFQNYLMPHPNLRVLGPNIKLFADAGVTGVLEQGAHNSVSEMAELRAWVLAKLLWDPSLDGDALVEEFLDGYYGAAAPDIRTYLKRTHDAAEESDAPLTCFTLLSAKFLSYDLLCQSLADLETAEEAVQDDPTLRFRVQVAKLPVQYLFLMRWLELRDEAKKSEIPWPIAEPIDALHARFLKVAQKRGITRLDEVNTGFGPIKKAVREAKQLDKP